MANVCPGVCAGNCLRSRKEKNTKFKSKYGKTCGKLPRRTGTISANYENCVLNLRFHLSAKHMPGIQ